MRFAFTDDQKLFRDSLRSLLDKECTPDVVRRAWNHENVLSAALWSQLADLGVLGLIVPEAFGGLGLREVDSVLLFEECGRAALAEPIVETMGVGAPLLAEIEDESRRDEWLPRVARGHARLAIGLRSIDFVTDAHSADLLLMQHGDDELHALSPRDVALTEERSVDGARRLARVAWTPKPSTLVAGGQVARKAFDRAFNRGALATAAQLLGLAQKMLDITVEYVKVRKQFGVAIGTFQAVKHHLADALVQLEFARPVVYRAAYTMSHDPEAAGQHVSMAKARASEAALTASRAALQCHGAIGYSYEHDLHLFMKRAWALARAWGDGAFHRARVGRSILGEDPNKPATTEPTSSGSPR